jgi:hypothetical protein
LRGQLFISDVLVSIIVLTIIVAFTAWEAEQIYNRAPDMQYDKMNYLANDIAQLAVKSILANHSSGKVFPNWIDPARWSLLQNNMSQMVLYPYAFNASISNTVLTAAGNGGCDSKASVAVVRRMVYINKVAETFTLKVCI